MREPIAGMRTGASPAPFTPASLVARSPVGFYLVFFLAGMPALIYQVTWQRILTLYFGVDIYSTSIIVATFMLGLGVGAMIGGRLADRVKRPGLYYAGIEALMGLIGFASIPMFTAIGEWLGGSPRPFVLVIDFCLLLLPTTLMGMTLPLMCKIVTSTDDVIGNRLSVLYAVNTFGAAAGAFLCSYVLIGLIGMDGATAAAAALNIVLAAVVFALTRRGERVLSASQPGPVAPPPARARSTAAETAVSPRSGDGAIGYRSVIAFSFLSGFAALGYELVWYRVLGLVLHGTSYVFGTILTVYLAGIALGSFIARRRIDHGGCIERFAKSQLGIAAYSYAMFAAIGYLSWLPPLRQLIGASFLTTFHPSPELVAGHADLYSIYSLVDVALWSVLLLAVPTVLMGYGFTNLIREGSRRLATLGHSLGELYFANIAGATLGSLCVGFVLIHYAGTELTLRFLILGGALTALSLFWLVRRADPHRFWIGVTAGVIAAAALLFPGRTEVIRALHFASDPSVEFVATEDRSGVSAVRTQHAVLAFEQERMILGQQRLYIDGSRHGDADSNAADDEGVEVALASHRAPRRVLSIGLGDAHMTTTAVKRPEVEELVVIELNSTLAGVLARTERGRQTLQSAKTRYIVDDGRRWLLANPDERFDVIMMYPLHAAHAFSGALYSQEFFRLLSRHLNEGGVLMARTVDLYSTARTLALEFPYVFRFAGSIYVASQQPMVLDGERLGQGVDAVAKLITADRKTILAHTARARINTDLRPNSEFYLTYPFAAALQTRFDSGLSYQSQDRIDGVHWNP